MNETGAVLRYMGGLASAILLAAASASAQAAGSGDIGEVGDVSIHALESAQEARRAPRSSRWGLFDIGATPRAFEEIVELGVGWIRVQLPVGDEGWKGKLRTLERLAPRFQQAGVGVWLTLYHRDSTNIDDGDTVGYENTERGGFPPADRELFEALVEDVVGRLAAALTRERHRPADWLIVQFGNEVNPRDVFPPDRPDRFWHGTADEYLAMLSWGRAAVRRVDRRIGVSASGISSAAMEIIMQGSPEAVQWNERLLREADADWADVHLRHRLDDVGEKVAWVRRRWSGSLAATEVAGPDPRVAEYSEALQADELPRRMRAATRRGVDLAFWASLLENPHTAPAYRREGLIEREAWRRKPAFAAYAELIAADER